MLAELRGFRVARADQFLNDLGDLNSGIVIYLDDLADTIF
jgi:hypothetical protein